MNPTHFPHRYEITIQGALDERWERWFEGFELTITENGETRLTGWVIDQAALYGVLNRLRDLGMDLISVRKSD
jgi:hypothetical protein